MKLFLQARRWTLAVVVLSLALLGLLGPALPAAAGGNDGYTTTTWTTNGIVYTMSVNPTTGSGTLKVTDTANRTTTETTKNSKGTTIKVTDSSGSSTITCYDNNNQQIPCP